MFFCFVFQISNCIFITHPPPLFFFSFFFSLMCMHACVCMCVCECGCVCVIWQWDCHKWAPWAWLFHGCLECSANWQSPWLSYLGAVIMMSLWLLGMSERDWLSCCEWLLNLSHVSWYPSRCDRFHDRMTAELRFKLKNSFLCPAWRFICIKKMRSAVR